MLLTEGPVVIRTDLKIKSKSRVVPLPTQFYLRDLTN